MNRVASFDGLQDEQPWDQWLERVAASANHIDPYTMWSLQTAFRQHLRQGGAALQWMDFLVELDAPYDEATSPLRRSVPAIYAAPMPGSRRCARHVTVRLPVPPSMARLAESVWWLVLQPQVHRAQIGFPRAAFPGEVLPPAAELPPRRRDPPPRPKVLLGALEDGCPFGHAALQGMRGTRVAALWDQSLTDSAADLPPADLGYGRVREQAELQALIDAHSDAHGVDEHTLYDDPRALQPGLRDHASHAAAVIMLMAGRADCMPSHPRSDDDPADTAQRPPRRGAVLEDDAGAAPLAVVQFPREQIDIAGARWMVVRALDGLRFLAATSLKLAPGAAPLPLVVNISYGSVVGAHDGTALLETAMADLAEAHGRMAIVLAAGNSHGTQRDGEATDVQQRLPSGRHAECRSLRPGGATTMQLYVPPGKPIETYLEIWFDVVGAQAAAEQFLDDAEVAVEVRSPTGALLQIKRLPGAAFDDPRPAHTAAGLLGFARVAQSRLRSMVLLVVASTQVSSQRVEVPSGVWRVRVGNRGLRTLRVQAWVERDMQPRGRTSQAARLLPGAAGDAEAAELNDDNSFNNIATGAQVFRVGALTWLGRGRDGRPRVSAYSSAAGRGQPGPELAAIADMSPALPGVRVSGNTSAAVARMNGTSVAAPQAARWIANQLADNQTLAQIRRRIRASKGDARRGRIGV